MAVIGEEFVPCDDVILAIGQENAFPWIERDLGIAFDGDGDRVIMIDSHGRIVDGDELQAAVNRPRIHHQWMPDLLYVEAYALSPETARELERRGHELRVVSRALGEISAVRVNADGSVAAAQDPRAGGGGAGVVRPAPR